MFRRDRKEEDVGPCYQVADGRGEGSRNANQWSVGGDTASGRGSGSRHRGVPASVLTRISCVTVVRVLSLSELQSAPPKSRDDTMYVLRRVAVGLNEIVWHQAVTE